MNTADSVFITLAVLFAATANRENQLLCWIIGFEFVTSALVTRYILIDPFYFAAIVIKDAFFIWLLVLFRSRISHFYAKIIAGSLFASQIINAVVFIEYYMPGRPLYFYNARYPIMLTICTIQLIVMAINGRIFDRICAWLRSVRFNIDIAKAIGIQPKRTRQK